MAEVNKEPPEDLFKRQATYKKYPWDEWADGRAWTITKDEDFDISCKNMQITIHMHARNKDLKVRTKVDKEAESITFQFYENTGTKQNGGNVDEED